MGFFLSTRGPSIVHSPPPSPPPDNTAGTVLLVQAAAAAGRGMGLGAGGWGQGLVGGREKTSRSGGRSGGRSLTGHFQKTAFLHVVEEKAGQKAGHPV